MMNLKVQGDNINFLELLQFLADHNESVNEVLQKILKNCKLTHHEIQKDIVNAIARETSKAIIKDIDNGFFSILIDESCDISVKKQMAFILRSSFCEQKMNYYIAVSWYCTCSKYYHFVTQICY